MTDLLALNNYHFKNNAYITFTLRTKMYRTHRYSIKKFHNQNV